MATIRETRLLKEFELMKKLRTPHSLFDFRCASLSADDETEYLRPSIRYKMLDVMSSFLEPEEFERLHPDVPPEKYLIIFHCTGLQRLEDKSVVPVHRHEMLVVFTSRYPSVKPHFVWLTPIWHPNLKMPFICLEGRPFSIGITLDLIVLEVGRMVQYQSYNVSHPLDLEAAAWAINNVSQLPIDKRDILDKRHSIGSKRVVELISTEKVTMNNPAQLVELVVGTNDNHKP